MFVYDIFYEYVHIGVKTSVNRFYNFLMNPLFIKESSCNQLCSLVLFRYWASFSLRCLSNWIWMWNPFLSLPCSQSSSVWNNTKKFIVNIYINKCLLFYLFVATLILFAESRQLTTLIIPPIRIVIYFQNIFINL